MQTAEEAFVSAAKALSEVDMVVEAQVRGWCAKFEDATTPLKSAVVCLSPESAKAAEETFQALVSRAHAAGVGATSVALLGASQHCRLVLGHHCVDIEGPAHAADTLQMCVELSGSLQAMGKYGQSKEAIRESLQSAGAEVLEQIRGAQRLVEAMKKHGSNVKGAACEELGGIYKDAERLAKEVEALIALVGEEFGLACEYAYAVASKAFVDGPDAGIVASAWDAKVPKTAPYVALHAAAEKTILKMNLEDFAQALATSAKVPESFRGQSGRPRANHRTIVRSPCFEPKVALTC